MFIWDSSLPWCPLFYLETLDPGPWTIFLDMSVSRASAMGHVAPLTAQFTHHVLLTMWMAVLFSYKKRSCRARELHTGGHTSWNSLCQLATQSSLTPQVLRSFSSPRRGSSWWCSFSCHSLFPGARSLLSCLCVFQTEQRLFNAAASNPASPSSLWLHLCFCDIPKVPSPEWHSIFQVQGQIVMVLQIYLRFTLKCSRKKKKAEGYRKQDWPNADKQVCAMRRQRGHYMILSSFLWFEIFHNKKLISKDLKDVQNIKNTTTESNFMDFLLLFWHKYTLSKLLMFPNNLKCLDISGFPKIKMQYPYSLIP